MTVEELQNQAVRFVMSTYETPCNELQRCVWGLGNADASFPWAALASDLSRLDSEQDTLDGVRYVQDELRFMAGSPPELCLDAFYFRCLGTSSGGERSVALYGIFEFVPDHYSGFEEPTTFWQSSVMGRLDSIYDEWVLQNGCHVIRDLDLGVVYACAVLAQAIRLTPRREWLANCEECYLLAGATGWPRLIGTLTEAEFVLSDLRLVRW